jgi:hypothetical protein
MKLPNKFSKYEDKKVLVITAGKQDVAVYKSEGGHIEKTIAFTIPRPKYSDNEGIYQKSAHGQVRSGSVEIWNDAPLVQSFLNELKKQLKDIKGIFTDVYIFALPNTKNKIKEILPENLQKNVRHISKGYYLNKSPVYILEKILKIDEKPFVARNREEEKILNNSGQARKVVR